MKLRDSWPRQQAEGKVLVKTEQYEQHTGVTKHDMDLSSKSAECTGMLRRSARMPKIAERYDEAWSDATRSSHPAKRKCTRQRGTAKDISVAKDGVSDETADDTHCMLVHTSERRQNKRGYEIETIWLQPILHERSPGTEDWVDWERLNIAMM